MTRRALAMVLLACGTATADTPRDAPTEIELDRNEAAPGRSELGFDSGAPLDGWGATLAAGWLERPITFTAPDGTRSLPVRRRETIALGGALALGSSVVVDARFAMSHQIGDRLSAIGDTQRLDPYVPGDLGLGVRLRVTGDAARAVFVRGDVTLPTGDQHDFAGEPSWSIAWRLIGRATLAGDTLVAASVGLRLRGEEVFVGDRLVGNEFLGAAGIAVPIPPIHPLWCVAEQVKLTAELAGVLGDNVGIGRGPSPVEARVGIVTQPLPSFTIAVRAGAGLSDEIGAPRFRAMLELTYQGTSQLIPPATATPDE